MELRKIVLSQIEQFLISKYLSISSVCFFLQSIRVLIEIDQKRSKYEITSHYCNWILHKELDRSNSQSIIKEIAQSFESFSSKNDLIEKISLAISIQKLVLEIKEILWLKVVNKNSVNEIDNDEYWKSFVIIVLNQITFRPLKLKEIITIDNLKFSMYGIRIVPVKEKLCLELLSKELEEKEKRIIIDIALFTNQNTTHNPL